RWPARRRWSRTGAGPAAAAGRPADGTGGPGPPPTAPAAPVRAATVRVLPASRFRLPDHASIGAPRGGQRGDGRGSPGGRVEGRMAVAEADGREQGAPAGDEA